MDHTSNHSPEFALRERVKELTCLYAISELAQEQSLSFEELLQQIVQVIPTAWQYPEHAVARIRIEDRYFASQEKPPTPHRQTEAIVVKRKNRGAIDIFYTSPMPEADEGPFLKEERNLIKAIAHKLAMLIERKEAMEEEERLNEQIRHADRLATIGELAAGIAHELNEPLANILGFAQLVQKENHLPEATRSDLEKIIKATLHARAIIKKLMYFSHQMPQRFSDTDLNHIIRETMYFLESRCTRAHIAIAYDLDEALPSLHADPVQLNQVVVNLVINAIQAMPEGGRLLIATRHTPETAILSVEDTGAGIPEDLIGQIFKPFLTTKEIGKGTGLGLSVVHGIVTAHSGEIFVESQPGQGTRFDIHFPTNTTHA
jgi:signal transduction histidine kinase